MSIEFKHGRMPVGYRRSDWSTVWYAPIIEAEPDDDETVPIGLFKCARGGASSREPMEAETMYFPWYSFGKGDADGKNGQKTRDRLQMQFLWDAWSYLNERNPAKIKELEQDKFNKPRHARWVSWFTEAKKYKKRQMGIIGSRRESRRRLAEEASRESGIAFAEIDYNSDSSMSGEDSGFESEDEERRVARKSKMPPPPRPAANGPKGVKRPGRNLGAGSKRSKPNPKGKGRAQSPPHMTAGRGGHGVSEFARNLRLGSHTTEDLDSDGEDGVSFVFDTRPSDHESRGSGRMSLGQRPAESSAKESGAEGAVSDAEELDELPLNGEATGEWPSPNTQDLTNISRIRAANGGRDDEAAFDEAIRRSVPPEHGNQDG